MSYPPRGAEGCGRSGAGRPRTGRGRPDGRPRLLRQRDSVRTGRPPRVIKGLMSVPGEQMGQRPLEELVQTAAQQVVVVAREQVDVARRELTARARRAGPGVAMVGGGALLAALASGTGTAALVLLLGRRRGAAAALGVTGAYAGAGAILAREGLVRIRAAGPALPDVPVQDEPVQNAKQELGSAKRRAKSAAKSPPQPTGRPKPQSKSASSRRRASRTQTDGARGRAS